MLIVLMLAPKVIGEEQKDNSYVIAQKNRVSEEETVAKKGDVEKKQEILTGSLVVKYAVGSEEILSKEIGGGQANSKCYSENLNDAPEPTLVPVELNVDEELPVAGMLHSSFTPVSYPTLTDIIGKKYKLEDLKNLNILKQGLLITNPDQLKGFLHDGHPY